MTIPLQPILVVLVYRGGERFKRALDSITKSERFFSRIILSVTAHRDSPDMQMAESFRDQSLERAEIICTGTELPTMSHQAFWINYLANTGVNPQDWIYWLSYDDEVKASGITKLVDEAGNWPLEPGTAYFGPWAMRHEDASQLFSGPWDTKLESWTSFTLEGTTKLPVVRWVSNQVLQPTYIQMSGSVATFESHQRLVQSTPRKKGPMRIELATASAVNNLYVAEFKEPVSIIYGRPNSDRSTYGAAARIEDRHLAIWLVRYQLRHAGAIPRLAGAGVSLLARYARVLLGKGAMPSENWVVRGSVEP